MNFFKTLTLVFLIVPLTGLGSPKMSDPIILMNPFSIPKDDAKSFVDSWDKVASYMKRQPGFISAKLHRGTDDNSKWFNIAKWRSVADFKNAVSTDEFKRLTLNFPGEGKPTLYQIVRQIND